MSAQLSNRDAELREVSAKLARAESLIGGSREEAELSERCDSSHRSTGKGVGWGGAGGGQPTTPTMIP
eukprot:COSAG01_NODE_3593_length_5898_cov_5.089310_3_plen_68_part_00